MWVLAHALWLRRDHPDWFAGAYRALFAAGAASDHVVAFGRGDDSEVVVVAARHTVSLSSWDSTTLSLPAGRYVDRLTGNAFEGSVALARC